MNCSPPGFSVHGILQARILEGSHSLLQGIFPTQGSNPGHLRCRRILYQLSRKGSLRILVWVAILSPVNLPDPGIELGSPALQADSLPTELSGKPQEKLGEHQKSNKMSSMVEGCLGDRGWEPDFSVCLSIAF